jgi:hypothetical protein
MSTEDAPREPVGRDADVKAIVNDGAVRAAAIGIDAAQASSLGEVVGGLASLVCEARDERDALKAGIRDAMDMWRDSVDGSERTLAMLAIEALIREQKL